MDDDKDSDDRKHTGHTLAGTSHCSQFALERQRETERDRERETERDRV